MNWKGSLSRDILAIFVNLAMLLALNYHSVKLSEVYWEGIPNPDSRAIEYNVLSPNHSKRVLMYDYNFKKVIAVENMADEREVYVFKGANIDYPGWLSNDHIVFSDYCGEQCKNLYLANISTKEINLATASYTFIENEGWFTNFKDWFGVEYKFGGIGYKITTDNNSNLIFDIIQPKENLRGKKVFIFGGEGLIEGGEEVLASDRPSQIVLDKTMDLLEIPRNKLSTLVVGDSGEAEYMQNAEIFKITFNGEAIKDFKLSPDMEKLAFVYHPLSLYLLSDHNTLVMYNLVKQKTEELYTGRISSYLNWLGDDYMAFKNYCGTSCTGIVLANIGTGETKQGVISYLFDEQVSWYTHFKDWYGNEFEFNGLGGGVSTETVDGKNYLVFNLTDGDNNDLGQKRFLFTSSKLIEQ